MIDLVSIDAHRAEINGVTSLAQDDFTAFYGTLRGRPANEVAQQTRSAALAVIPAYGDVAASSALSFYAETRPTPGHLGVMATPDIQTQVTASLSWALAPLFTQAASPAEMVLTRVVGLLQMYVAQYDRETIAVNADRDPVADGYRRYPRAGACAFCIYMSLERVSAHSSSDWHGNCHCVTAPVFGESVTPDHPQHDEWSDALARSRRGIEEYARDLRSDPEIGSMRRGNFFKTYPDAAINRRNLLAGMRRILGTH